MEDAMAKAFEVNENTEKNRKRQPQKQPADNRDHSKPPGKAFQVNGNSEEDKESR
jgi:hypothetical protein